MKYINILVVVNKGINLTYTHLFSTNTIINSINDVVPKRKGSVKS